MFSLHAQNAYRAAGLGYEFPNDEWYLQNEQRIAPRLWGVFYKSTGVKNDQGIKVIPNMVVIKEDLVETDQNILQYALSHVSSDCYSHLEVEVDESFRLNFKDAILFKDSYLDPKKLNI